MLGNYNGSFSIPRRSLHMLEKILRCLCLTKACKGGQAQLEQAEVIESGLSDSQHLFNTPYVLLGDGSNVTIQSRLTAVQQGGRQGRLEYTAFDNKWNIIVFCTRIGCLPPLLGRPR